MNPKKTQPKAEEVYKRLLSLLEGIPGVEILSSMECGNSERGYWIAFVFETEGQPRRYCYFGFRSGFGTEQRLMIWSSGAEKLPDRIINRINHLFPSGQSAWHGSHHVWMNVGLKDLEQLSPEVDP